MRMKLRIGILLLGLALCGGGIAEALQIDGVGVTLDAKKKTRARKPKKTPSFKLSGSFELDLIYDDNILRMSPGTVLEFREFIAPYKFLVSTRDDLIISPKLSLNYNRRVLGRRNMDLRVSTTHYRYSENPIKNNDSWFFRLRQQTFGRDYAELTYSYSPVSYIRQLSDRPPFTARSTTSLAWIPFKSSRNAFALGYFHRFGAKLSGKLNVGRVTRFYNQPFMENDNWEWNAGADGTYSLSRVVRLNGRYSYSNVEARAYDSVGESHNRSDDGDPSYERDLYEIEIDLYPRGRLWKVNSIALTGQYQAYYFTSKRPPWDDPLHVGRQDEVYVFETAADTRPLFGPVSMSAGYRYSQRVSSLPARIGSDSADEKDYKDNRIWVGAAYPF